MVAPSHPAAGEKAILNSSVSFTFCIKLFISVTWWLLLQSMSQRKSQMRSFVTGPQLLSPGHCHVHCDCLLVLLLDSTSAPLPLFSMKILLTFKSDHIAHPHSKTSKHFSHNPNKTRTPHSEHEADGMGLTVSTAHRPAQPALQPHSRPCPSCLSISSLFSTQNPLSPHLCMAAFAAEIAPSQRSLP